MWRKERDEPDLQTTQGQDLRSIGITPAGLETDINTGEEMQNLAPIGPEAGGIAPASNPGTAPPGVASPGGPPAI